MEIVDNSPPLIVKAYSSAIDHLSNLYLPVMLNTADGVNNYLLKVNSSLDLVAGKFTQNINSRFVHAFDDKILYAGIEWTNKY